MAQFSHRKYISGREKCLEKNWERERKRVQSKWWKNLSFEFIFLCIHEYIYRFCLLPSMCCVLESLVLLVWIFFYSKPKLYVSCLTHSVPSCFWRFISNVWIVWFLLVLYTASCIRLLYVSFCMYCFVTKKEPNNSSNTSK